MTEAAVAKRENRGQGNRGQERRNRGRRYSFQGPPNFDPAELAAFSGAPLWQAIHDAVVETVTEAAIFVMVQPRGHEARRAAIPSEEFSVQPGVGDVLRVRLLDPPKAGSPVPVASMIQAAELDSVEKLNRKVGEQSGVQGYIVSEVRGGFSVALFAESVDDVDRPAVLRAFLPRSQATHGRGARIREIVGEAAVFDIHEFEGDRANVVVARRKRLMKEHKQRVKATWARLQVGDRVRGIVRSVVSYGAFVDVDGVDALLHASDISWDRQTKVSSVLHEGQEIDAEVVQVDKTKNKLKIGMKQLGGDPWNAVKKKVSVGSTVDGDVVAFTDFGAFLRLEEGIEGLIHTSELSWKRVRHPSDKFSIGERVTAQVLAVDDAERRISLSTKVLEPNPYEVLREKYPEGTPLHVKVKSLTEFGAFVEVDEGVDGLVHLGEMSWVDHIEHPSELLTVGQDIDVVVMQVDTDRQRVSCSIRRLQDNPWLAWEKMFMRSSRHTLKVTRVTDMAVEFEMPPGLSGTCHVRDLATDPVSRAQDVAKIGSELEVESKGLDKRRRRVNFSVKAVEEGDTRQAYEEYKRKEAEEGADARMTLGDAIRDKLEKDE